MLFLEMNHMSEHKAGDSLIWDQDGHFRGESWGALKQRILSTQGRLGIIADDFIEMLHYRGAPLGPKTQTLRDAFAEVTAGATEEDDIALLARILDLILQQYPDTQFEACWFLYYIRDRGGHFDVNRASNILNHLYNLSTSRTQMMLPLLGDYVVDLDATPPVHIVDLLINSGKTQ
jgi:hypothetical protein